MLDSVWMILFWPIYVVGCGLIIGQLTIRITKTPIYHRPLVLACCAFANSTGLPITLLSVIHQNFPPSTELGKIDPTLFLSIYLLIYPVLQWGIGGWLLMKDESSSIGDGNNYEICKNDVNRKDDGYGTVNIDSSIVNPTDITEVSMSLSQSSSACEQTNLIASYHERKVIDCTTSNELQQTIIEETGDDEKQLGMFWSGLRKGFEKAMQPPVVGALSGLLVASSNPIRGLFVDMIDRNDNAWFEWFFDGLYSVS